MANWEAFQRDIALSAKAFGTAMWLLDRDGEPYCEVRGWISHDFGDSAMDVAEARVTIFADNPVVPWLLARQDMGLIGGAEPDIDAILHDAVHLIVQTDQGIRWGYRIHELSIEVGGARGGTVELIGLRPLEHWKHIALKSNTDLPNEFQLLWSDIRYGQSLAVIKSYIHKNLERAFQPLSLLGQWDLSTPSAWSNVDTSRWRIVMNPTVPSKATEWTVLEARYDTAWDALSRTAHAAGLMMTAEYWLPGDTQPAPQYFTLSEPTIVLDVVNRSIHRGATGTIADPIRAIARQFTNPGSSEVSEIPVFDSNAAATASGLAPWVVWKPSQFQAVSRFVVKKSTDDAFVIGGKSPAALNAVLSTGMRALAAGLGSLVPGIGPALAVIAGDIIEDNVKDRILAFQQYDQRRWRKYHGRLGYLEVSKPGEAYTLSAVQQAVAAMEETGGSVSFEIAVLDDQPYKFGRDFFVGDQGGVQLLGMTLSSFISEVHLVGARGERAVTVGVGDPRLRESQSAMLSRNLETVSAIVGRLKTQLGG